MSPAATLDDDRAVEALQAATDDLFYRRGIAEVTMAEVRDVSGVSLRRIYALCPSKDDLVSLWLRHRHETWGAGFRAAIDRRLEAGDEPVDAVFAALEAWLVETGFRGCGFINTRAERWELTDEQEAIIRHHKQAMADHLHTLTGAGDELAVLVDGAIVRASMFASTDPVDHARRVAELVVAARP